MSANVSEATYRVERSAGSTMSGCHGSVILYKEGEARRVGYHGITPEGVLGRSLGHGTIVEVRVRVIEEHPMPADDECINPWSGHAGRPDGYVMRSCVGHPEHEPEGGRSMGVGR